MKCEITGEQIKKTFLGKILGTVVKDENGKKHFIGSDAQQQYSTKEELLDAIKNK